MRLDVLGLQAFVAIADSGGFHAAAHAINLSQTALSHRIRKLEAELETQLFDRSGRQIALTREGMALLPRVRQILGDLHSSMQDIRLQGILRQQKVNLGCIPTLATQLLPPLLRDFSRLQPDIRIRVYDGYASTIAQRVQNGELDFALTIQRATYADLDFLPLFIEPFLIVCPADHPLAQEGEASLATLNSHSLIRNSIVADALIGTGRLINWRFEVETVATALEFVRAGMGLTIVPKYGVPLAAPDLRTIALTDPVTRVIGLLQRMDGISLKPARDLSAHLRDALKA